MGLDNSSLCRQCGSRLEPPSQDGICQKCCSSLPTDALAPDPAAETAESSDNSLNRDVPEYIGPYTILESLGKGGMGIVYLAEQAKPIRRRVALKVIRLGMDTEEVIARFKSERQALALMNHPNIAQVFDAGSTERGAPYFVMEFVPGLPITRYCDTQSLGIRERLAIFTQVCDGVQHAHQKGIIHRDLKPSNILVTVQGDKAVPKIIDFGVAKATDHRLTEKTIYTQQGRLIGTPEYMSPEQAEMSGLDVDTRTDVYSLGVLLYELLAGTQPFSSRELRKLGYDAISRKIREEEPAKPSAKLSTLREISEVTAKRRRSDPVQLAKDLRGDLDWITMKCLEKDRTRRYSSPSELSADVNHYLRHEPVLAGPPSNFYRARKFVGRHKFGVAAAALVWLALLIGITGTTFGLLRAQKAEKVAREQAQSAKQVSDFLVGLFQVSDPNENKGNTITAREILDRGAEKINRELMDQPLVQGRMMITMGRVYQSLGLYKRSSQLLEEGLKLARRTLGEKHLDVAYTELELGWVYRAQGKYDEAERLFRDALSIRERTLGPDHPYVAYALQFLGMIMRDKGAYPEARQLLERSLAIRERALGPEHLEVSYSLYHLGWLLRLTGRLEDARKTYERALSIMERRLGPDDIMLAWCLNDLSVVYENLGNLEKARPLLDRSLTIKEKILGPEHPDVAASLNNLGVLFWRMHRFDEAETVYNRALAIRQKALGPAHGDVAGTMENLALLYQSKGDYERAGRFYEQSLVLMEKITGPDHQAVVEILQDLAGLHKQRGAYPEARILYERILAIDERKLGTEHPDVASVLYDIADLHSRQGNYVQAEPLLRRAMSIQERIQPIPAAMGDTIKAYVVVLHKLGKHDEADKLNTRLEAISKK